ncbi:hypothetical protein [Kaarinaea lacus]
MNEIYEYEASHDDASAVSVQEFLDSLEITAIKENSATAGISARRQIDIMLENKMIQSAIREVYDF